MLSKIEQGDYFMIIKHQLPFSVPDPDLDIKGGGLSSRPLVKGGPVSQKQFWALQASFWSKNKGGAGPSPRSAASFSPRNHGCYKNAK